MTRWFVPEDPDEARLIAQVAEVMDRVIADVDARLDALMPREPLVNLEPGRTLNTTFTVDDTRPTLGLYTVTFDVNASDAQVTPLVGEDSTNLKHQSGSGLSAAILLGLVAVEVGGTQVLPLLIPAGWSVKLATSGSGTTPTLDNAVEVTF